MYRIPTITKNLLIINVLMFFATWVFGRRGVDLNELLGLHFFLASDFGLYQLFTYMFMHAGFMHIFLNMLMLWMFGCVVENVWGPRKFLFYYIACGVGAGVLQMVAQFGEFYFLAADQIPGFGIGNVMEVARNSQPVLNLWTTVGASGAIYGVLLDSETGVRVDNIAMRGCSGEVFTSIPSDMLSDFFRSEGVALVVLQFGGNSIPFSSTTKAVSAYASRIRRQLSYLARVAPDVRILFIGPSDMATRVNGVTASYPVIGEFVDSLRNAVTGSGAAYWDLYSAMGGRNSMLRWVESDPPLAGSDYVHFTPAGAERVASMLSDTFLLYYDYYHWRKEHD